MEVKMNEIILNAISEIEKQLAHIRELITNQPEEIKIIEQTKVIDDIITNACKDLINVKYTDIQSRTRKREVVDARAIVIAFNYFTNNKKTLRDIGAPVGVDHSTVLHSLKKFCDLYRIDGQWRFLINDFFNSFENNYAQVSLDKEWTNINKTKYFCMSMALKNDTVPYATFQSISDHIDFLIDRNKSRMENVKTDNLPSELAKFYLKNVYPNVPSLVYDNSDVGFYTQKADESIKLFDKTKKGVNI
jgi:hypothetical protein